MIGATTVSLLLHLALIFSVLVSRSAISQWLLVGITLIGLVPYAAYVRIGVTSMSALADIVVATMQLVAIASLFSPSARAWMAGRDREAVDQGLHDTFK